MHQLAEPARLDKGVVYHDAVVLAAIRLEDSTKSAGRTEYDVFDVSTKGFMGTDREEGYETIFSDDMAPSFEVAGSEWSVCNRTDEFANHAQVDQI